MIHNPGLPIYHKFLVYLDNSGSTLVEGRPILVPRLVEKFATKPVVNFLKTSYELLTNILWASYKYLMSFLQISYEFLADFTKTFYKLLRNFLQTSYRLLTNFFQTSYKLLTNFLQTSYKPLKNLLQSFYNVLITSYSLLTIFYKLLILLLFDFLVQKLSVVSIFINCEKRPFVWIRACLVEWHLTAGGADGPYAWRPEMHTVGGGSDRSRVQQIVGFGWHLGLVLVAVASAAACNSGQADLAAVMAHPPPGAAQVNDWGQNRAFVAAPNPR